MPSERRRISSIVSGFLRVKKQKFIFFRKEEFDRLMEKRFSEDDFIANIDI